MVRLVSRRVEGGGFEKASNFLRRGESGKRVVLCEYELVERYPLCRLAGYKRVVSSLKVERKEKGRVGE